MLNSYTYFGFILEAYDVDALVGKMLLDFCGCDTMTKRRRPRVKNKIIELIFSYIFSKCLVAVRPLLLTFPWSAAVAPLSSRATAAIQKIVQPIKGQ